MTCRILILIVGMGWASLVLAHPDPLENIKIYTYILSVSPENPAVFLNRGICYRLVADFEKAIADLNQAEALGLVGRAVWMNRAMSYLPLRKYNEALADVSKIIEKNPKDSTSLYYRGEIYFKLGKFREAIQDYTQGLEGQSSPYLFYVRADAYRTIGELTHSLEDYTQAIALADHMVPFRIARAKVFAALGRYQEARRDLDDCVRKQPERYQIYLERAILSASQSLEASRTADLKAALKYVEDEIFFRPSDPAVYADRALVYEQMGDLDQATEDLNKAVEFAGPNDPTFLRRRADFLQRQEKLTEASADRTQAVQMENLPIPTATPLPGPTLTLDEIRAQPTPNLLPEMQN